jgi:hypothetical protein
MTSMTTFRLDPLHDKYEVVCEAQNTRTGFRHVAVLLRNGIEIDRTKCTYQNRTWESFQFQSVLHKIIGRNFDGAEKEIFLATVG